MQRITILLAVIAAALYGLDRAELIPGQARTWGRQMQQQIRTIFTNLQERNAGNLIFDFLSGGSMVMLPDVQSSTVSLQDIPEYAGEAYVTLNEGVPYFSQEDLKLPVGEYYTANDWLGRCHSATAMLDRSLRPQGEREDIGQVKPSGWVQNKYPGIVDSQPPYLYNRCHLIAYAMTGQNANERNLITGTRYLNVEGMLPFEKTVLRYMDGSDNHVLYRVTPIFREGELLARGVEMEAYSVEDYGAGVCFNVFIYNVQPGIGIDYRTGENWAAL